MKHKFNSAGVSLIYGYSILLGKRIEKYNNQKVNFGGYWSIFAGEREPPSEKPQHCACRELYEETGIKLKSSKLHHVAALRRGMFYFDVYISYIDYMPKVKLNEEHTEFGWFNLDHLDIEPNPVDPTLMKKITKFHNSYKND